jgi:hypothetical protein
MYPRRREARPWKNVVVPIAFHFPTIEGIMKVLLRTVAAACMAAAVISLVSLLFPARDANAQGKSINSNPTTVSCPVNTCGKTGGPRAKDAKYCSAANCKKGAPK